MITTLIAYGTNNIQVPCMFFETPKKGIEFLSELFGINWEIDKSYMIEEECIENKTFFFITTNEEHKEYFSKRSEWLKSDIVVENKNQINALQEKIKKLNKEHPIEIKKEIRSDFINGKEIKIIEHVRVYHKEVQKLQNSIKKINSEIPKAPKLSDFSKSKLVEVHDLFTLYYSGCGGVGNFELKEVNYSTPIVPFDLD